MGKRILLIVVVIFLSVGVIQAQNVTGTIVGTVIDSTGAAIPNAQITILNQDTGISRTAVSSDNGEFRVPQLVSGVYTVSATAPGLTKSQVTGVTVAVNEEARVDLKMSVASTTTEVQVSGEAIAVNTEEASVSTLMTTSAIDDVPLNARDIQQLAVIQPGVQADPNDNWGNEMVIAGSRPQQNRYLDEGIDTTWTAKTAPVSAAGIVLGVEAVKEFQVLESNYTAEFGERLGGTLNTIWKSGTNAWHGSAYDYLRNSWFDAMGFFDHQVTGLNGVPLLTGPPAFHRNQFGAAFGGPIKKDKDFFYVNYEGYRHNLGQTQIATEPDNNARIGELPCNAFAGYSVALATLGTAPAPCTLATPTALATVPGFTPNGFIQAAMALFDPPCTTGPLGGGECNSANVTTQGVTEDFVVGKVDLTLGAKDSLSTSYKHDSSTSNTPQVGVYFNLLQEYDTQIFTTRETRIFSPTFLNTLTLGVNRTYFLWNLGASISVPASLGTAGVIGSPFTIPNGGEMVPGDNQPVLPIVSVPGLTSIAVFSSGTTVTPRRIGYTAGTINDDVDLIHGKHALKFGVQYKRWNDDVYNSAGTYQGTVAYTSLQNFLANSVNTFGQTIPGSDIGRTWETWLIGAYAQDTYKALSNLTFTLGLRWEMVPGVAEAHNRITNLQNPYTDVQPETGAPLYHGSPRNFEPRIGIAYDPFKDGKTSIRAGFGIFHDEIEAYNFFISQGHDLPFSSNAALKTTTTPVASWPVPSLASLTNLPTTTQSFANLMPLHPKTPVKYSYNFEIQRQLPDKFIVSVGYVGSFARHLGAAITYSDYTPEIQQPGSTLGCGALNLTSTPYACGCPAASLYPCYFWPGSVPTATKGPIGTQCAVGVPLPTCSVFLTPAWSSVSGTAFDTNAFYNSVEARLQRHIGIGANMALGFTHLSCITDSSGETPGQALNGSNAPTIDLVADSSRGPCAFTARDVGTLTLSYDIPLGKSSTSTLVKVLVAGWQISSLTTVSAGFPVNALTGYDYARYVPGGGGGADRPNLVNGCTPQSAVNPGQEFYYKISCFAPAEPGYQGNTSANVFTGPSFWDTDASLRKDYHFAREGMALRLQVDMFNVFNRANLGTPTNSNGAFSATGVPSATFGQITSMVGTPRQLQLGARFSF